MKHLMSKLIENYKSWNNSKSSFMVPVDVKEIILQQNDYKGFNRLDIVVRYLAIEEFYEKNKVGYNLYLKMQKKRKHKETCAQINERLQQFKQIILDWERNGYRQESEITCDRGLGLLDGSHRLALSLYFNTKVINCRVYDCTKAIEYGLDWFLANGFTDEEIEIILCKWNELKAKCKRSFTCILWNCVSDKFDEITKELKWKCELISYKDYVFKEETYKRLVKGIYSIDDIEDWKVDKKIEAMKERDNYNIRVIYIQLDVPRYRIKDKSKKFISKECENIKKIIRSRYKDEIHNYMHDIIIHIADNYEQSEFIANLLSPELELDSFFKELDEYIWMMIKSENNYIPDDFPVHFPFSKDIDLLCQENDFLQICQVSKKYFEGKLNGVYNLRVIDEEKRCKMRFELDNFLILQLDISYCIAGIRQDYLDSCLVRRIKRNGVYSAQTSDEVVFRLLELSKKPHKTWHKEFLKNNNMEIKEEILRKVFYNFDEIEKVYLQICSEKNEV